MTPPSAAHYVRRFSSSPRSHCARLALWACLLASSSYCGAQELVPPQVDDAKSVATVDKLGPEPLPPPTPPNEPVAREMASATVPPDGELRAALERPGTLNLHDVELGAALFMISEQWGINIVSGKVEGSVNGVFRNAPLREILDSILLSNGYNYRAVGESLVVSSVEDLGQINPFFQSATIPVRSADIDEVVQGAKLLTTPQGQVQAIKSARSIVVLDFPDRVKMIRDFVSTLDSATRSGVGGAAGQLDVGYFRTQHIPAKVAEDALQAVLSKEGRVGVMEGEDRLVVSDHPENLLMVKAVLERIDRPRPQVRITALIYDISLQDIEELGINWRRLGYADSNTDVAVGVDPITRVPLSEGSTSGPTIAVGALLPHFDLNAVANALKSAKDARLLANPSVAVLENEEAQFESVSEIPYQQLTQTGNGPPIGTTSFKDAGITLTVKPKVSIDGTIHMVVQPKFSRLAGFTPAPDNQPIIDKRVATTTLTVANRQTVAIGGLRQRQDIGDFSGIPYLMDARYIGKYFRYRKTDVRESELVLFISPEIISPCDPVTGREAAIIDAVGCRLNQLPEAEGCPPPCGYGPPVEFAQAADPIRLPVPDLAAGSPQPPAIHAATPDAPGSGTRVVLSPRRLPSIDQPIPVPYSPPVIEAVPITSLFDAPPPAVDISIPQESPYRMGGAIEVGSGNMHLPR